MAGMYPTPLPETVAKGDSREAERKVYDALATQLGPAYSVFYSVAWLAKSPGEDARDGEVDFVVVHPELGTLLLEVKGGTISRDGVSGRWTSIDRFGHVHQIHDPFDQVRRSKHALLGKLLEHPALRGSFIGLGHGVVFPDSANPHRPLGPDAPAEITLFADDLDRMAARIEAMFDFWGAETRGRMHPAPRFVETLTEMLAPTFHLRQLLGPVLAGEDRALLRLTEEQFGVLDLLARERRVAVSGGAGTGKTVLALEKARRLAAEGLEVLLTCFNRPLAEFLRRCCGQVDRLTIANFHHFCWQMAREAGVPLPDPAAGEQPPEFFDTTLPEALLTALERLPARRFDAIVVDEGQDFRESWWAPLELSLADRDRGILYVFHDDNQQVYRRLGSFPTGLVEIPLHDNLRNTRRIHAVTTKFYRGEPLRAKGPEGREVECVCAETQAAVVHEVSRILHRLVREEGVPAGDVAVLYGSSTDGPLKRDDRIGSFWTTTDQVAEPQKVLLDSVRRFKGLERPVIVLTGIDHLPPDEENALLYVGSSRARVGLAVVAAAATLERLGLRATTVQ
jgi:Nuclease-related domain/UvrD-like helicase C-terminal domain